jgi:hypothetical protein
MVEQRIHTHGRAHHLDSASPTILTTKDSKSRKEIAPPVFVLSVVQSTAHPSTKIRRKPKRCIQADPLSFD